MRTSQRIVIVEDDSDTGAFLVDILGGEGYEPTLTQSAVGAESLVKRLRPLAIVLDLGLPFRSGVSLLSELKANPLTAAIPVVVYSAQANALPAPQRQLAAAVLPKPIDLHRLLEAVQVAASSNAAPTAGSR